MRLIKSPSERKMSITFSMPKYIVEWLDKMKQESSGFDKNKLIIDRIREYMKARGDLNEEEA